jgi:hypothetical protein
MSIPSSLWASCELTDWDDEGGEGVATDDTSIVHDVLRGDLPIRDKIG